MNINKTINQIQAIKFKIDELKNQREELEQTLIEEFKIKEGEERTTNYQSDNYKVSFKSGVTYKVDKKAAQQLWRTKEYKKVIEDCIDWKPSLKLRNYRTSTDMNRIILDKCIISKPSKISVTIKPLEEEGEN